MESFCLFETIFRSIPCIFCDGRAITADRVKLQKGGQLVSSFVTQSFWRLLVVFFFFFFSSPARPNGPRSFTPKVPDDKLKRDSTSIVLPLRLCHEQFVNTLSERIRAYSIHHATFSVLFHVTNVSGNFSPSFRHVRFFIFNKITQSVFKTPFL